MLGNSQHKVLSRCNSCHSIQNQYYLFLDGLWKPLYVNCDWCSELGSDSIHLQSIVPNELQFMYFDSSMNLNMDDPKNWILVVDYCPKKYLKSGFRLNGRFVKSDRFKSVSREWIYGMIFDLATKNEHSLLRVRSDRFKVQKEKLEELRKAS